MFWQWWATIEYFYQITIESVKIFLRKFYLQGPSFKKKFLVLQKFSFRECDRNTPVSWEEGLWDIRHRITVPLYQKYDRYYKMRRLLENALVHSIFQSQFSIKSTNLEGSFVKEKASATLSDNDQQWVVQWVTTNGNEWYNEWQRVVQRVTNYDTKW